MCVRLIGSVLNASTTQLLATLVRYEHRVGRTEYSSHTSVVDIFGINTSRIVQKFSATSSKIRSHCEVYATKETATGRVERDIMKIFGCEVEPVEPPKNSISRVPTVHYTLRMYLILHKALSSLLTRGFFDILTGC